MSKDKKKVKLIVHEKYLESPVEFEDENMGKEIQKYYKEYTGKEKL